MLESKLSIDVDPAVLIEELSEYGAWGAEELQDHDQNIERIIWIAAGDIQEDLRSGGYHD